MASPESAPVVKLFVITIHSDVNILQRAAADLESSFGPIDWMSEDFPFDITDYYQSEMGTGLNRRFYSFAQLIHPDEIAAIKLFTNSVEDKYRRVSGRSINLDPGYMDTYKVVLASAKFGGQKIYLRDGIYADMTLLMNKGKWESFIWGFPDFKSGRYDAALSTIRNIFKKQVTARTNKAPE
jgi:hypothetical protein